MAEPEYLAQLNPRQRKAVDHLNGPVLILAGAGSGKTMALTYRAAHLLLTGTARADEILMATFTNKAAAEMKHRIATVLRAQRSAASPPPFAGTFHSLCARILRADGAHIGIAPSFVIYDDTDQKAAIKYILKKRNISPKKIKVSTIRASISNAKNELIDPDAYASFARGFVQETVADVYAHYQDMLAEHNAVDFDDLIMKTAALLQSTPQVLTRYQRQFRYILVDEYQDTNHAQYVLIKLLTQHHGNLCVVGDASQSIYSWRGADFRNIVRFQKDFPDARVIRLEQNYRSSQIILDAAYSVISQNKSHPILKLWTDQSAGAHIQLCEARNEQIEALNIAQHLSRTDMDFSDAAVLYRTNAQSRAIEELLLHESIPYVLVGGVRFYERREIKDVLAYLRLLTDPTDPVSRLRLEKLGKRRLHDFLLFANSDYRSRLEQFTTQELLDQILERSNYLARFESHVEEDATRLENIKELRSVAAQFPNIYAFFENVALVEQESRSADARHHNHRVTLMTMHAAKGLEFDTVFLVGMEEGLFPHSRSLLDNYALEEERRLCYVGMTRARKQLFLSYARRRLYFGSRSSNMISRFVQDIPPELLKQEHALR